MEPEIRIEVTRGGAVESVHRGIVAVSDGNGQLVLEAGDTRRPVFPRSAIKVLQGLPLIETGAADALGLGPSELSLACASHSGEEGHVELASSMLRKVGLGEERLECGCHWPFDLPVALALAKTGGEPTQLHNNCSGKHAGFLCTSVHLGEDTRGYVGADHPAQLRARAAIADVTGIDVGHDTAVGVDGCSIPTYAAPLDSFAAAFARLVTGQGIAADRSAAGRRLIAACMAEPWYMSGTKRKCLQLMEAAPGRVFAKTGAEGVFCGAVPELGLGFALKIDDGTTRASEALVAATLSALFRSQDAELSERYDALARRGLRNWNGTQVGEVRAVAL